MAKDWSAIALQAAKHTLQVHQEAITRFSRVVIRVVPRLRVKVSLTTGAATGAAFIAQIAAQRVNIKWRYPKELN